MASHIERRKFLTRLLGRGVAADGARMQQCRSFITGPASSMRYGGLAVPSYCQRGPLPLPRTEVGLRNSVHTSPGVLAS